MPASANRPSGIPATQRAFLFSVPRSQNDGKVTSASITLNAGRRLHWKQTCGCVDCFQWKRSRQREKAESGDSCLSCLFVTAARSASPSNPSPAKNFPQLAGWRPVIVFLLAVSSVALAQARQGTLASNDLPEAPVAHIEAQSAAGDAASAPGQSTPDQSASDQSTPAQTASDASTSSTSGFITGTVEDSNNDVIEGAHVVLTAADGKTYTQASGEDGQFSFAGLPPGTYAMAVTGKGWGRYSLPDIQLSAGESRILSHVILPASSGVTEVRVDGSAQQLSIEQEHIAVQQRVLGVFPNFYSSYDWHAPPMLARQKYALAFRSMIDPMTFAGAGMIAGVEQWRDTFPGYGQGVAGYGRRYGAAYANSFTGRMLGGAAFPSLFHQDPRYFYKGSGSVVTRALYAISTALITKGDNGRWQPNYSHVLGNFTAGAISNLYYPASSQGLSLTLLNGALETAGDAATDFMREFFLRGITSHVPSYNNGQP